MIKSIIYNYTIQMKIKTMLMENCKIQRKNYKIRIEFHAIQNKVTYNTI